MYSLIMIHRIKQIEHSHLCKKTNWYQILQLRWQLNPPQMMVGNYLDILGTVIVPPRIPSPLKERCYGEKQ